MGKIVKLLILFAAAAVLVLGLSVLGLAICAVDWLSDMLAQGPVEDNGNG